MDGSIELRVAAALNRAEAGFGRVRIDSATMKKLGLEIGDVVEIKGKRSAAAKVLKGSMDDEGRSLIRMDGITRTNVGVSVDENVTVRKVEPRPAEKISIEPASIPNGQRSKFPEGKDDIFKEGLIGRPVLKGNTIVIPNVSLMGSLAQFMVVNTVPADIVYVTQDTKVIISDRQETKTEAFSSRITYDDVGGLEDELKKIREMIELPLKHPELFDNLGITAPKGVLLYGPPGTGKTLIAKAVARESGASFYSIQGPEIIGKYYGQSEERLREIFGKAKENSPSIIFLDEIDSIAPNRNNTSGEVERRVVAQLLTLMDGLSSMDDVIVIAATNREDSIDPALRRPGRFDREIEIGIPSMEERADILGVHLRTMPLEDDVSINKIAAMTHGFVGADLASLAREAAMKCLSRNLSNFDLDKPIPSEVLSAMKVNMNDFTRAFSDIEPSGMREVLVEVPKVQWTDIGGLDDIKKEIREVFTPTEGLKDFERLGIRPPKGLLLYGPPGTGKTLLAKAMANESGANFICINGPELSNKWMGETEKAIRQVFKRARQMAPSILFFDEIDSIAPRRTGDNAAWERAVNQLLTSMDGIEELNNVTVVAATNRPDRLDPALLRPGRFDKLVLIGKPDKKGRKKILEVHTSKMPLKGVDLDSIAERTDGYVGADIEALCREAALVAYRKDHSVKYVNGKDFDEALKTVRPSVNEEIMKEYEHILDDFKLRQNGREEFPFYG